jgi:hypothetical protein
LRVPITDVTKDIYLTVIDLFRTVDGMSCGLQYCDFSLTHTSGNVDLGQPRHDIVAPSSLIVKQGHRGLGWIIPAATVAAKVTTPSGSAIPYLSLKCFNPTESTQNAHFTGIITEYVN